MSVRNAFLLSPHISVSTTESPDHPGAPSPSVVRLSVPVPHSHLVQGGHPASDNRQRCRMGAPENSSKTDLNFKYGIQVLLQVTPPFRADRP